MFSSRFMLRSVRPAMAFQRPFSVASRMAGPGNAKGHETADGHRKIQAEKPLNPHMTNTNSAITNDLPSAGSKNVPPELITSVDPDYNPKDAIPENTERMTGSTQKAESHNESAEDMGVGELEGGKFKIEPLRRTGEDANTMRARLLYQSRKRGTLESDLLMSTFAEAHLREMSIPQMAQFDLFLDENDWDIYYWATQEPTPTSQETAEGAGQGPQGATANAQGKDSQGSVLKPADAGDPTSLELETDAWRQGKPRSGEWAQTIGTFKPAYRPVPIRWKNSEILAMLRRHVKSRSAGGVHEGKPEPSGKSVNGMGGGGMAFMPPVFQTDRVEGS